VVAVLIGLWGVPGSCEARFIGRSTAQCGDEPSFACLDPGRDGPRVGRARVESRRGLALARAARVAMAAIKNDTESAAELRDLDRWLAAAR
jgi:hypothetical protein